MKNIIIGKNGFIAQQLYKRNKDFIFTTSNKNDDKSLHLDLQDVNNFNYDIIDKDTSVIFLAAISSPDECNNNYDFAYNINVIGSKHFIKEALKRNAKVLFFSSDVIYGNCVEPVDENSNNNPFGIYAQMKNEIEENFNHNENFKVFRLSYVLSKEDKYLSYLDSCISRNETANVFHPFSRKVVYIVDVLEAIEKILKKWEQFDNQKFNICGEENVSRKDIADFYNEAMRNKLQYKLIEPNDSFWEARPKNINIHSIYLEKLLDRKPIKVQKAINSILNKDKK